MPRARRPTDRPNARVSIVAFDDEAYPESAYLLDCPRGLNTGAHVWIWIDDEGRWREAVIQNGERRPAHVTFVRVAGA